MGCYCLFNMKQEVDFEVLKTVVVIRQQLCKIRFKNIQICLCEHNFAFILSLASATSKLIIPGTFYYIF